MSWPRTPAAPKFHRGRQTPSAATPSDAAWTEGDRSTVSASPAPRTNRCVGPLPPDLPLVQASLSGVVCRSQCDVYKSGFSECTVHGVDVSVTELRAHLSDWLDRARAGGEVVITDRGIPVARLAALDSAGTLERLTAEGVIGKATAQRPVAAGRSGPRPRRPVSDRVSDQRR